MMLQTIQIVLCLGVGFALGIAFVAGVYVKMTKKLRRDNKFLTEALKMSVDLTSIALSMGEAESKKVDKTKPVLSPIQVAHPKPGDSEEESD